MEAPLGYRDVRKHQRALLRFETAVAYLVALRHAPRATKGDREDAVVQYQMAKAAMERILDIPPGSRMRR